MIDIIISNHHDVYTNVAIERYLFSHVKDDIVLFLWSNNPCVVFGRNQNIYNEVDIPFANNNNISLVRRFSGGGAVFQDLGNLNYTFFVKDETQISYVNQVLLDTFNVLGIKASFSGRNDLVINDQKFSGIAYSYEFDHIMYHGTCLIDSNVETLTRVLKPHDYKLKSHSVSSYKSRVTNLVNINPNITGDSIKDAFIQTIKAKEEIKIITEIKIDEEISRIIKHLKDKDYIYNSCPSYCYSFDIRLNNANYHFDLDYHNGVINDVKVYSDDLNVNKIDYYVNHLKGYKIEIDKIKYYIENL